MIIISPIVIINIMDIIIITKPFQTSMAVTSTHKVRSWAPSLAPGLETIETGLVRKYADTILTHI